jgi:hypothetical protein
LLLDPPFFALRSGYSRTQTPGIPWTAVTADTNLEQRLDYLDAAVEALFQVVDTVANNAPALANGRGPLDEIRKGLADVAVALKSVRQR